MLSRVAGNIYWLARYLERAENTTRIVMVHSTLLLDLPRHLPREWSPLLAITGSGEAFYDHYRNPDERNVSRFLIGDVRNPGSILPCLKQVRENLRTTRDSFPREVWEHVNDLCLWANDTWDQGVGKREREAFLQRILGALHQVNGMLNGNMSRGLGFDFMQIGTFLERADMTTRVLDVRAAQLMYQQQDTPNELDPFANLQWMNVLNFLSAYQMYRSQVRLRVLGPDVINFLLRDRSFPRAYLFCIDRIAECSEYLPDHSRLQHQLTQMRQQVNEADVQALNGAGLTEFLDQLQIALATLHSVIGSEYLGVEAPAEDKASNA